MNAPVYITNPEDGIATYDTIDILRSVDSYASVYANEDIDLTTRNQFGPGYTQYMDLSGNSSYSYKTRFKNSVSGAVSELSDILLTGSSYAISEARRIIRDADSASYVFTDAEVKAAEKRAVGSLFPRLLVGDKDESKTIVVDTLDYDLPVNCFRIKQVFKGTVADGTWEELENYENIDGKTLRLDEGDVGEALKLTIYFNRPLRNSGEVPLRLQPIVIYEILGELYEMLANDRGIKFKAFQALQRDSDIRPETLKQMAQDARATAERLKSTIERG